MKYYSEAEFPPIIAHRKTSETMPIYAEVINTKTNKKELKKVGETNIYEKIQESKDSTDIQKIIERYQINLDDKAKINEEILDYTNYPTDLIEAHAKIVEAENIWNQEGMDIKKEFNNNFLEYLAAANNGNLRKVYEKFDPKRFKKIEEPTQPVQPAQPVQPNQTTQPVQQQGGIKIYE